MTRSKIFVEAVFLSSLGLVACNNGMKFEKAAELTPTPAKATEPETVSPPPPVVQNKEEILKFKADVFLKEAELDVVWVVDNSTSMSEEIAHVKDNLRDFADHVAQFSSLRTYVLSKTDPSDYDAKFTVDVRGFAGGSHLTAFDNLVGSKDGLFWASKMVCKDKKDCKETLKYPYCTQERCKNYYDPRVETAATNFLRPNARKAFVFVTDDESSELSAAKFLEIYGRSFDVSRLKVFSFVTLSKEKSPCGDTAGLVYQELSQKTKGASFNICDANWRPHFEAIAQSLEKSVKNRFAIKTGGTVKKVIVDGRELTANQFRQETAELKINEDLLTETSEIEVTISVEP